MLRYICIIAALVLAPGTLAHAITLGQVDTFSSGLEDWWGYSPYQVLPDGGPAGVGDAHFYNVSASLHGRLTVVNSSERWRGNYANTGVTALRVDLINFGPSELQVRARITGPREGGSFASTQAYALPPDGQWHRVTFGLTPGDLTWIPGTAGTDLAATLADVDSVSFAHLVSISSGAGTAVTGAWGLDNITAIPEPCSLLMLMVVTLFTPCHRRVA